MDRSVEQEAGLNMSSAVHVLNTVLTASFDLLASPMASLPPIWTLAMFALVAGAAMVWVFGRLSNQNAIRTTRDRIRGTFLGAHVYRQDPRVVLRMHARIVRDTGTYLRLAAVPLLVMLIPVVLVMAQLQLRLAVSPVPPGRTALVRAVVRDVTSLAQPPTLEVPSGVRLETPAVRVPNMREVSWRVRVLEPGRHALRLRVGTAEVDTTLVSGSGWGAIVQRRTGRAAWDLLLNPGAPPIDVASAVEAIEITYPALDLELAGWQLSWPVAFLGLSLLFGFALKGVMGVEV